MIKAIISDVYGTLLHVERQVWYKPILDYLIENQYQPKNLSLLMCSEQLISKDHEYGQQYFNRILGVEIPITVLKKSEALISKAVKKVKPDTNYKTFKHICDVYHIPIWLCSNLSTPFVAPIDKYLSKLDRTLSCEQGQLKPNPILFKTILSWVKSKYNVIEEEIAVLGDSYNDDIQMALQFGIKGFHLTDNPIKNENPLYTPISNLIEFKDFLIEERT